MRAAREYLLDGGHDGIVGCAAGARAVYTCALVIKEHDRARALDSADFCALSVPDRYVFGCGMDYHGYLRNLPAIYAVGDG